jgi:hypothetical protein
VRYLDRILDKFGLARFAARLMRAMRKMGVTDELRFDAAENRILRLRDGKVTGTFNLNNIYRTYRQHPRAGRAGYLRILVQGLLTPEKGLPDEFDLARSDLRPRLWSRASFEQMRLRYRHDGERSIVDLPLEPIGEHLLNSLAYDWPQSVQTINGERLAAWDVTLYEAMEVARQNLAEATLGYVQIGDNLYSFTSGDTYDASRLTLIDRIQDLEVVGRTVAMVPNRHSLFISGSEDELGLTIMADLAEKALLEPYPLSGVPLILDGDEWVDWMPAEDHPLHRRFRRIELNWIGPLYAIQKEHLDAIHDREEIGIFVASFSAVRKADEEIVSYCVWGEGVESLLPVTHKVVFMMHGHDGPVALGDWDRVVRHAGDLLEQTDDYPRRYRTRGFPDAAALEAIGIGEI